jgi:hypothetical protein
VFPTPCSIGGPTQQTELLPTATEPDSTLGKESVNKMLLEVSARGRTKANESVQLSLSSWSSEHFIYEPSPQSAPNAVASNKNGIGHPFDGRARGHSFDGKGGWDGTPHLLLLIITPC